MLGSFATTQLAQATYHFIPKDKKQRTPGLEEFSIYYTSLPLEHKTLKFGYWHKNPYQYYVPSEGELGPNGVDFGTIAGEPTLATSFETISPTGVDLASAVGEPTLVLTTSESLIPTGVDFESAVGSLALSRGILPEGIDLVTEVGTVFVSTIVESKCRLGHELTPFFLDQQASTNPRSIVKQFTFNNSVFSDRVVRFPQVKRAYADVVGKPFSITLENASQLMNDIIQNRTNFRKDGEVAFGYQFNPSFADFGCVGKGFLINADYSDSTVTLNFKNQMDILSQVFVSTDTTSQQGASFVGSNYNPADLTFTILTANSYGAGLDGTTSTANTDIEYESWVDWKNTLGSESIVVQGFFPYGTNYVQALQGIAELTDSAIYVEANNKIYFRRNLVGTNSFSAVVSGSDIISFEAKGDAYDMCNRYTVPVSFAVQSNAIIGPKSTVTRDNTASINSYDVIRKQPTSNLIWYVDTAGAANLGDRIVFRRKEPELALNVKTPLKYMQQQLGDLVFVNIDEVGLSDQPYTLIAETIDIENNTMTLDLSVGHGIAIANISAFELDDPDIGTLNNTVSVLA
jgi:hypothetical protein